VALGAKCVAGKGKLGGFPFVKVFKGDVHAMHKVLGLASGLRATASASAEESAPTEQLTEEVLGIQVSVTPHHYRLRAYLGIHPTHSALLGKTSFTASIVYTTLLWVGKNLVSTKT